MQVEETGIIFTVYVCLGGLSNPSFHYQITHTHTHTYNHVSFKSLSSSTVIKLYRGLTPIYLNVLANIPNRGPTIRVSFPRRRESKILQHQPVFPPKLFVSRLTTIKFLPFVKWHIPYIKDPDVPYLMSINLIRKRSAIGRRLRWI